MPMVIHSVAFSPTYGVYLGCEGGKPIWTFKEKNLNGTELAPTFEDKDQLDGHIHDYHLKSGWPEDVRLCEVWPSKPDFKASADDCRNSAVPGWGEKR